VALNELLPSLQEGLIGVVETGRLRPETGRAGRGLHVWVLVRQEVGSGFCTRVGGEVLSGPHLAMLPPSRHPDGTIYRWLIGPRIPEGVLDLQSLGLVPDTTGPQTKRRPTSRLRREPASLELQTEFRELMSSAGLQPGAREREKVSCLWHREQKASLHIDWVAAIFHCFGCDAKGGVVRLRELLGVPRPNTRSYLQKTTEGGPSVGNWGVFRAWRRPSPPRSSFRTDRQDILGGYAHGRRGAVRSEIPAR
jgi:hypothetical protein